MSAVLNDYENEPIHWISKNITWDRRNSSLSKVIEVVGEEHIVKLVSRFLSDQCKIRRFFHVQTGLSGAVGLGVECDLLPRRRGQIRNRSLVLKLSRDRNLIQREYERRRETVHFPQGLFPKYVDVPPQNNGGWHAIAVNYVRCAETLRRWLFTPSATPIALKGVLGGVFLNPGLKMVYGSSSRNDAVQYDVALQSVLTTSRSARILLALDELSSHARAHDSWATFVENRVRRFVQEGRIEGRVATHIPSQVCFTRSHGDLHSENILVDQRARPWLIDAGDIDMLPWPSDLARLSVDLIIAGLDTEDANDEWGELDRWLLLAIKYIVGGPLGNCESNTSYQRVYDTLEWIRGHVHLIHDFRNKAEAEQQFRLGLAIEFLRATYRVSEFSTPKRVFALLSGDIALMTCSKIADGAKFICMSQQKSN